MRYQDYVDHARKLLSQIESHQAQIAEIALKVCEIRHGGPSEGVYTLSRFADDIGLERRTLSNWVALYRDIILKAGIKKPTPEEWAAARITGRILKNEATVANKRDGQAKSKGARASDQEILKLFEKVQGDERKNLIRFERLYTAAKNNNHLIETIDLNLFEKERIISVKSYLEESLNLLNSHLFKRERRSISART